MSELKTAYCLIDDFICMSLNRMPRGIQREIFHDLGMMDEYKDAGFSADDDTNNLDKLLTAIELLKPVLEKEWEKEKQNGI